MTLSSPSLRHLTHISFFLYSNLPIYKIKPVCPSEAF
jgi:hypothetical protein